MVGAFEVDQRTENAKKTLRYIFHILLKVYIYGLKQKDISCLIRDVNEGCVVIII